jgi:hypothetical protein
MIDEKTCIILPGILSSFSSLKKRLLKTMDEHMKELKRNKNVVDSYASTPLTANTTSQSKTVDELRSHIIKSIDQWIDKYRNDFDLQADSSLVESVDYKIVFKDNVIDQSPVVISRTCRSKSSLIRHASNG